MQHFLLLRHQIHASPLYTARRTALTDPLRPRKAYGAAQANARYADKNRATQDPFTAVASYSQRFVREERALPDWSRRPISRELWPKELLDTVDAAAGNGAGGAGGRPKKKRRLELSSVSALPNAERAFGLEDGMEYEEGEGLGGEDGDDVARGRAALERLDALGEDEEEKPVEEEENEDEGAEEGDEDLVYDDEDAGDYNAEVYFDNGDELGDDYGDEGDGEGTF